MVEVDLRTGGTYRLSMTDPTANAVHTVGGKYLEVSPPQRLVYTWTWETRDAATTLVTVEFHEAAGGTTTVVLTHSGFPTAQDLAEHDRGWRACLANLAGRVLRPQDATW